MRAARTNSVRDHLGKFGFQGDRAFEPVGRFSGGEKARLTLALLVARRPNLLLLDEPTNHLDIDMRHALSVALQGFEGGLVIVSHDRHLIKTVADTLWLVADGKLKVFDGDLDDYQQWLKSRGKALERFEKARQRGEKPTGRAAPWPNGGANSSKSSAASPPSPPSELLLEAELCDRDEHGGLADRKARLARDAASLEARWMEVGIAIEAAEAQSSNGE